jgi:hypothetical protein
MGEVLAREVGRILQNRLVTATSTSMYNCYCNKVYDASAEARGVLSGILIYLIGLIIREFNYQII